VLVHDNKALYKYQIYFFTFTRDPEYITADIKAKLCRENRLIRAGRIEEADCLAECIGKDIIKSNKARLSHINPKTGAKDMWTVVRHLTGRKTDTPSVPDVTADSLNNHYAAISTDKNYQLSPQKPIDPTSCSSYISEWRCSKSWIHSIPPLLA